MRTKTEISNEIIRIARIVCFERRSQADTERMLKILGKEIESLDQCEQAKSEAREAKSQARKQAQINRMYGRR